MRTNNQSTNNRSGEATTNRRVRSTRQTNNRQRCALTNQQPPGPFTVYGQTPPTASHENQQPTTKGAKHPSTGGGTAPD